jgi:pimeloyl-ACP methyl ester carboxylesterase
MSILISALEQMFGVKLEQSYYMSLNPRALFNLQKNARDTFLAGIDDEITSKINVPCLFYVGESDSRLKGAKKTSNKITGAKFISLPHLNHWAAGVRSDLVVLRIKKFLAEVEKD